MIGWGSRADKEMPPHQLAPGYALTDSFIHITWAALDSGGFLDIQAPHSLYNIFQGCARSQHTVLVYFTCVLFSSGPSCQLTKPPSFLLASHPAAPRTEHPYLPMRCATISASSISVTLLGSLRPNTTPKPLQTLPRCGPTLPIGITP